MHKIYTIFELIIFSFVSFIFLGLIIVMLFHAMQYNKQKVSEKRMRIIADAIYNFYLDNHKYPVALNELVNSNYMREQMLKDGWGKKYIYNYPGEIISYGRDGAKGGEDLNKDIIYAANQ